MCSTPKMNSSSETQVQPEIIKKSVQADAASQKADAANRTGAKGIVSDNLRAVNSDFDDSIISSKKKLLGE